jgi:hypothetical protein
MSALGMTAETQERVWWYFFDVRLRYAFAVLFVGLVLVQSEVGKGMVGLGLIWIAASILLTRSRVPEPEVDRLLSEDVNSLIEDAERCFRVEDHELRVNPLVLLGPVEANVPTSYQYFTGPRTGRDGRRRSPVNRVVILVPMEDRLGVYSCCRDLLRGETSQVIVEEHNYKDVVSVKLETLTERDKVKSFDAAPPEYSQVLTLELSNKTKLTFPVLSGPPGEGGEEEQLTGAERTMRAIQTLLGGNR